jgi:hypothetical protein
LLGIASIDVNYTECIYNCFCIIQLVLAPRSLIILLPSVVKVAVLLEETHYRLAIPTTPTDIVSIRYEQTATYYLGGYLYSIGLVLIDQLQLGHSPGFYSRPVVVIAGKLLVLIVVVYCLYTAW